MSYPGDKTYSNIDGAEVTKPDDFDQILEEIKNMTDEDIAKMSELQTYGSLRMVEPLIYEDLRFPIREKRRIRDIAWERYLDDTPSFSDMPKRQREGGMEETHPNFDQEFRPNRKSGQCDCSRCKYIREQIAQKEFREKMFEDAKKPGGPLSTDPTWPRLNAGRRVPVEPILSEDDLLEPVYGISPASILQDMISEDSKRMAAMTEVLELEKEDVDETYSKLFEPIEMPPVYGKSYAQTIQEMIDADIREMAKALPLEIQLVAEKDGYSILLDKKKFEMVFDKASETEKEVRIRFIRKAPEPIKKERTLKDELDF